MGMALKKHLNKSEFQKIPLIIEEHCSREWFPLIEHYKKNLTYSKGEYIFKEGESVKGIKFIDTGRAKVVSNFDKNSEKIVRLAGDGTFLGHRGFGTEKTYPVSAIALSDTNIIFLPSEIFLTLLKTNNQLSFYLLNFFADELRNSELEAKNYVRYTAKQRIVAAILNSVNAFGYDINEKNKLAFTLSRQEFANLASTTYETVIRCFSELDKQKIIRLEGKEIRIINQAKLNKVIAE